MEQILRTKTYFADMYMLFLLWTSVCMYMRLLFWSSTCIHTFTKVNLCIYLPSPAVLWSNIWLTCHLYHTFQWVAIKDNTCVTIPTISLFGLDDNHNTKSLSPFDIKGKGRTKIFSSLIYILLSMLPLSTCWSLWMSSPFVHAKTYKSVHAPPWAHARSTKA